MIILANILIFIAPRTAKYYFWGHSECGLFPNTGTLSHKHMGLDARKPVFAVSDKVRFKAAC